MRVTEITYERKKNCGNYEHALLSLTAVLEEGETLHDNLTKLENIADWRLNAHERDAKHNQYTMELASENCEKREAKEKWIATYEARKAEMEGA